MDYHALATDFAWAAVLLGLGGVLAQYRRARRLGVEGVSTATWVLFVFMGGFWITYGMAAHSSEVTIGSLIVMPFQLAIVFRLQPWKSPQVVLRSLAFFVAACVMPTLLWGWVGGVYGTGVAMVVNRGPQILELIREEDASGVSVTSWLLGVAGTMLWVAYYQNVGLWAALISTAFAGLANLTIALLATWRHRQARQRLTADEVFAF
ncbi:MAG TPA: hypothetical protein VMV53_12020 [Acidimicrobiales bacterium]|nr:hypothetical protein [Acidimicrobiales bacterium]